MILRTATTHIPGPILRFFTR